MIPEYYSSKEVANRFNLKLVDVATFGRFIKVQKMFGQYTWLEKDVENLEKVLDFIHTL